ncbi:Clan CA, family C19, ubiquitin hydrolase-like cysteine peptidase [Trichomonas vaginalis G3]|uniref:ubiquitinyl hydrolase 1 n=1 Tax=Trichomonas vaginalis (strain ATCC PRA-98 / G3) TaxID=412133 RepID=A2FWJ3_TRIV3|nr:ubiquitinyl hydrolase protein [Trichomonas vaginalis G3]EAX90732.1 Clan CA, family C19, ubiquitin hydrolase-like cysteine peptidase [Trichomonas vaginalis G3]KAI5507431.1 ubiquitinyl hydrolase protein [Trichomonas vaginalis G3]|eukprot:XP_001303662.1 Clan CA, family C19, ubiquitin hydrolase-like cysteine peptidase [Trichomonas vaginalis G3]
MIRPENHSSNVTLRVHSWKKFEALRHLEFNFTFRDPSINKSPIPGYQNITMYQDVNKDNTFDLCFKNLHWDTDLGYNTFELLVIIKNIKKPPHILEDPKILYRGIENLSNHCYINVNIQMLFHIPAFRKIIYSIDSYLNMGDDQSKALLLALRKTFILLEEKKENTRKDEKMTNAIQIDELLNALSLVNATQIEMNDSHWFLDRIFSTLNDNSAKSEISNIFGFEQLSNIKKDGESIVRLERCLTWPISINQNLSFEENIKNDRSEIITETGVSKQYKFKTLPKILIISTSYIQSNSEQSVHDLPTTLSLSKYVSEEQTCAEYELYCIIWYHGNSQSGHFYSCLRPNVTDKDFYLFNDARVTKYNIQNINKEYAHPHVLAFVRKDSIDEMSVIPTMPDKSDAPVCPKEITEQKLVFEVRTTGNLANSIDNGFIGFKPSNATDRFSVELSTKDTFSKLYEAVKTECENYLDKNSDNFRLWIRNKKSLLGTIIPNDPKRMLYELNDKILFLDQIDYNEPFDIRKSQARVFLVYFDPAKTKFTYILMRTMSNDEPISGIMSSTIKLLQSKLEDTRSLTPKDFNVYVDKFDKSPPTLVSDVNSNNNFKHGTFLIFVPKNAKTLVVDPPNSTVRTLEEYYPENRIMTLERYYITHYYSWDFKVFRFGPIDQKPFFIKVASTLNYAKFAEFLAKCCDLDYDKDQDDLLVFPVVYEHSPKTRPIINQQWANIWDPYMTNLALHALIKKYTTIYFEIFKGYRGKLFNNKYNYGLIRVSISKDGIHVNELLQCIVDAPYTPRDVLKALKREDLGFDYRIRKIDGGSSWTLVDIDTSCDDKHCHYRFELKPKEDIMEITVCTGTVNSSNGHFSFFGEPFLLPVEEGQTFIDFADPKKFPEGVTSCKEYDIYCLDEKYEPCGNYKTLKMVDAVKNNMKVAVIPLTLSPYLEREKEFELRG